MEAIQEKHHVKGTAVKNFQNYCDVKFAKGYFDELKDTVDLSKSKNIMPSTWYPVSRYIEMHKKAAKKAGMDLREFVIDFTRFHLEIDMNGVYRFFMKAGGPQKTLSKLPSIDKAYSNYTRFEIELNEKGKNISKVHVPEQYHDWYLMTLEGGFRGVLNVCKTPLTSFKILASENYEKDGDVMKASSLEILYLL